MFFLSFHKLSTFCHLFFCSIEKHVSSFQYIVLYIASSKKKKKVKKFFYIYLGNVLLSEECPKCKNKGYPISLLRDSCSSCVLIAAENPLYLCPQVIFNRPGVAGAVLQSPPSFIHSLIH